MATTNQVKVINELLGCGIQKAAKIADSLIPSLVQEQGFQLFVATVCQMDEMHDSRDARASIRERKEKFDIVRENCELAMQAFYKHNE